jgi:hypothetical protein
MNSPVILPVEAIAASLNNDKEFRLSARFWYCDLRFSIGSDLYFMRIEHGEVESFVRGTQGFDPYAISVSASEDVWVQMLQEKPKPFYHDWFAASFHHELEIGGDLESAYAYYYSIRRIHACMAECYNAQKLAA